MKRLAIDPSRRVDLYLRCNRVNEKTFSFLDSTGQAMSLVYEDFQIFIKRYPGDRQSVIDLTVGDGLTIDDNELTMSITAELSNVQPGQYYWEMYKPDEGQTWLNGLVYFNEGLFDGVISDITTLQVEEDSPVTITINNA